MMPSDSAAERAAILDLHAQGKLDEAAAGYRVLIDRQPNDTLLYVNLAQLEITRARFGEAIARLYHALEIDPSLHHAALLLGDLLKKRARWDEAVAVYRSAIAADTTSPRLYATLGATLFHMARVGDAFQAKTLDQAIDACRQAIALDPDYATAHMRLGRALHLRGARDEAIAAFRQVLRLKPDDADATHGLAVSLNDTGKFDQAAELHRRTITLKPDFAEAYLGLGTALFQGGDIDGAVTAFRHALAIRPSYHEAYSNLIFTLEFGQLCTPTELVRIARGFEDHCRLPTSETDIPRRPIDLSKKLRIGIISAEIGRHAVAYFLMPYLRNYDRARFEVTLYPTSFRPDSMRDEMVGLVDQTIDVFALSDEDARRRILADDIDILIDTTSHTAGSRMRMLTARCAQIQCHYIGFTPTTGLSTIDYFIGDDEITPPELQPHVSDTIWRLPNPWMVYEPPKDAPTPEQLSTADELVLGSFNNLAKVRNETLDLWGELLAAIPQARLVLKDKLCSHAPTRARILARLRLKGVNDTRISFINYVPSWADHMQLYNQIDIALDTFPFNSCTTAYDALLMGTPVVAMRGQWYVGRMTSAMLTALGRPDWIAETTTDYLAVVRRLGADKAALRALKSDLRAEMLASPLCDGPALARALEAAFIGMAEAHNASTQQRS